jgi:hypothetical protein
VRYMQPSARNRLAKQTPSNNVCRRGQQHEA